MTQPHLTVYKQISDVHKLEQAYRLKHPDDTEEHVLKAVRKELNRQQAQINREYTKLSVQDTRQRTQKLMDEKQSVGNKQATGKWQAQEKSNLRALQTDTGITTDPDKIKTYIEAYYSPKLKAPNEGIKTGKYMPHEAERAYPWEVDPRFAEYKTLLPYASRHNTTWLHDALDDEVAFHTCLKTLARGKVPGPDKVANEILQALPAEGKQALHNMIRIMWATGLTPTSWKESMTVLLFKHKGTPLDLKYYRRIGLENTVYKLWTRMVTFALADRAERMNMISASQGGFRNKRTTVQQMEMMVMAIEDAHLFKQDIYLLQADMTEAFDTIDHDKLLMIMYDLGFPTDAIEVVKDLYTNATTTFQTPFGPTPAMQMNRGTIQGDSLSPFLFIIYLEPLLRWLKAGNKGYPVGALGNESQDMQQHYRISDITYADDLNALTGGPSGLEDLKHQAAKISAYTTWGHLIVNNSKTTVTGALYKSQPGCPYDDHLLNTRLKSVQVQDKQLTYQSPRQPFRHLGVLLTMDMNYKHQLKATLEKIRSQVNHLKSSQASTKQKLRVIETCIRPAITYAMAVAPYTLQEIRCFDRLLTRATKQAHKLSVSMSTAAAHQDIKLGGLGCHSLEVEYHTICTQRLIRGLNDTGPLGVVSRALFQHQQTGIDALTADKLPYILNNSMRIRQLMAMKRSDLHLLRAGEPEGTIPATSKLASRLAAALPQPDKWDTRLVHATHLLHSVGVTTLESMMTADRTHMLPANDLKAIVGSRNVKHKHLRAWNVITRYLHAHDYPETAKTPVPTTNLAKADRSISQQVLQGLKPIWPANPTARPANILHLLLNVRERAEPTALRARDEMLTHIQKMTAETSV